MSPVKFVETEEILIAEEKRFVPKKKQQININTYGIYVYITLPPGCGPEPAPNHRFSWGKGNPDPRGGGWVAESHPKVRLG